RTESSLNARLTQISARGLVQLCFSPELADTRLPHLSRFSKVGTTDLDSMFIRHSQPAGFVLHPIHAQPAPLLLRGGILSLHHHQLLPAPAIARQPTLSRPVLERAGAGAAALPFYCNRIRHHARARPPAAHRARA